MITDLLLTFSGEFPVDHNAGQLAVEMHAKGVINLDTTLTDYGRSVMEIVLKVAGEVLADNGLMKGTSDAGEN
jgi:hypothetical protein